VSWAARRSSGFTPKWGAESAKIFPVNILVVRPATTDEIEFCRWGDEALAREGMARRI
jgi:hypothetical protein